MTARSNVVLSMTGFGASRVEVTLEDGSEVTVTAEIKTVNHKHLLAKFRLPAELSSLESGLEKTVRSRLARGSVAVSIDFSRSGGGQALDVDFAVADRYLRLQRDLTARSDEFGLEPLRSVADLLGLPGVVVQARAFGSVDATSPEAGAASRALEGALDSLLEMRRSEGASMLADLVLAGDRIEALVGEIEGRMPGVQARHQERLVERVRELVAGADVTGADLAREMALIADRLDVSEEVVRLGSHIAQLRELLDRGGEVGRKLDFLAQEFFREANTIGSKCNDAEVAHLVVDLKTHVERLREQVQNVE